MTAYEVEEVIKGNFVAVYSTDPDENQGLPFWIGRVHSTEATNDEDDEESDGDDVPITSEWMVKVEEYTQTKITKKAKGRWTGVYRPLKVHGPKKGKSAATSAKAVYTAVPIEQIAYVFTNLSSSGTMSKDVKDWVSFRCEVAVRLRAFDCPGFEDFNEACGHKTMPYS